MRVTKNVLLTGLAYVATTVVGFVGTWYFARELGPGPLGTFALGVSLVRWAITADFGVGIATIKRISESDEESAYMSASTVIHFLLGGLVLVLFTVFSREVNEYIGVEAVGYVMAIYAFAMLHSNLASGFNGTKRVHVKNWFDVVERVMRVGTQAGLVALGLGVTALYTGYTVSIILVTIGMAVYLYLRTNLSPVRPSWEHFRRLFDFAKFSWLGRVKSQSISWMDIFVLGFFVQPSQVGIYQVAWTVTRTFELLSTAISANVFPEISDLSSANDLARIRTLISEGFVYAGVIPIPGIVGAALVGQQVLQVYGEEFTAGYSVLVVLGVLAFVRSYERHVTAVIDSLDYPERTFRINTVFVVTNTAANIVLIWQYGAIGAAIASVIAMSVSFLYSWWVLNGILDTRLPYREIGHQAVAAVVMGASVQLVDRANVVSGFYGLLLTVFLGGVVYFVVLLTISVPVRKKAASVIGVDL
ncbi:oligosaccharide flippase family protein [Halobaculum sp. EA56]|uniref:oligosaccharide flippase family protein n=1 Tax=Halobaculum sp. EA56 TaxID=3421648 RepID=UPI003EC12C40